MYRWLRKVIQQLLLKFLSNILVMFRKKRKEVDTGSLIKSTELPIVIVPYINVSY